ncbi:hypothetical protein M5K25_006136 [Dendrobium thyrsiflorum]|uniref:RAB6-interacting golgin n=1 Tax=Dendrobium thyrsiflorum TaxID=117978 RepID=A0ABD0VAR1_DENTH
MDGKFATLEEMMKKMFEDKQKPVTSETTGDHRRGGNLNSFRGRENPEVEVLEGDDGMPPPEPLSREEMSMEYDRRSAYFEGGREEFHRRESSIADRIQDIKKKDQSILNFENAINEKSESIFSLQSKIELLRKQAAADAEQSVEKVNKQASEMEKQVARLKSEIKAQTLKRGTLEARGAEAEKKMQELNLKLERVGT